MTMSKEQTLKIFDTNFDKRRIDTLEKMYPNMCMMYWILFQFAHSILSASLKSYNLLLLFYIILFLNTYFI